jgi:glycosyltransferase involved in cell wall biosynthesis
MKIGFVLSQPFGRSIGTDVRIRGLIEGLNYLGVELHLITPFRDDIPVKGDNIFVHRVISLSTKLKLSNLMYNVSKKLMNNQFLFKNLICKKSVLTKNALSLGRGIFEVANKLDLDILQAEQPIASIASTSIRDKLHVPVVADFHGIWAEEMVASNVISYKDACYKVIFDLEKEIACSADAVTVVSEEMKNYFETSIGSSSNKVVLIPNATFPRVDSAKFAEHPSKVIHSGTLHPWENVELFAESMPFVLKNYSNAKFYLTRKGAKLNTIKKLTAHLGVSPEFIWFNSGASFFDFLKSCDIGVISSTTHLARKMAYPAKLYDYLSVGLPIVANDIGGWTKIIKENKVGIVTQNDPEAYAAGIVELLKNPDLIHEFGQRGIDLVKRELNYYKSAQKLLNLYKNLT